MPSLTIFIKEEGKIKNIYLTKEERDQIEKLKEEGGFKTLKDAYFFYQSNREVSLSEKIKFLENRISELQKENDNLKRILEKNRS